MSASSKEKCHSVYQATYDELRYGVVMVPDPFAHELVQRVSDRCKHFLDMSHFGAAQMIVGNTLLLHRPLSREKGYTTLGSWWRRIWAARHPDHECMCGWNSKGEMIEYHQADMVNQAVRNLAKLAGP